MYMVAPIVDPYNYFLHHGVVAFKNFLFILFSSFSSGDKPCLASYF